MTAPERPARLAVGIVGPGRVGAVLGAALARAGHRVVATSAVSQRSRDRVEVLLPEAALMPPQEVLAGSDLVLLTVPDDVLPGLIEGLVATGSVRPGQFLVHTSGRFGVDVLDAALRQHALPMALHPVMTFTGNSSDLVRLSGAAFGVTSSEELRPAAEALVLEVGGEPVWVEEMLRPLWHAALTHGANHLVTLIAQSLDLLREAGVAGPSRVIGPLLSAALDNSLRDGESTLTGPVARGDAGTVAAHVRALAAVDPEALRTYRSLARATADRAVASGRLRISQAEALLDALAGPIDEVGA